jgi:hypothetical protein
MGDALAILAISLMGGNSTWHNQGHPFVLIFFDRLDIFDISVYISKWQELISFFYCIASFFGA